MTVLPSGTVNFLFTDIEGSTRLWEEQPDTMRLALARHDALLRAAIETNGGTVFKTIGDAFCAAFPTAPQALEAALAAQQNLHHVKAGVGSDLMLKVRMALHTGTAEQREGDYYGPTLNRVARLMAVGHGGQILLSEVTNDLCRDALPPGCSLKSLGEHRLKDLGRPETVFQLCHPDLPADFPPLRSLDNPALKHNLPLQLTSFIGREKEGAEIKALLDKSRLLTLTGSGGCGKTRLGLQVAAEMLDVSGDGVWLVELASLSDPALVPQTVASVLGIKEEAGKSILQTLTEQLKSKHMLLVLDNCEHLLEACARLVDGLLRSCPRVLILATSREGLGIAGERAYRVPSLSLPDLKRDTTPESLPQYEAVQLFIERAQFHQPQFLITRENASSLASVCYRLDGIPLAIELAAARVRSLTVEDINARLDQRFRLLTGGSRTALPRQQTLRAMIDWSYDLLNEAEKAILCRLSVFAGGWTLEAAEVVCAGEPVEDWEVLDLLTSLSDKSLVVAETSGSTVRYRMLETVRQYARDRLLESGDGQQWRESHLAHFLALAEEAEPQLIGPAQALWLERLEAEHDNLRAALEWSLEAGKGEEGDTGKREKGKGKRGESGLRLAGALWWFWYVRGHFSEGRERLTKALAAGAEAGGGARARALSGAGVLARMQGDYPAARTLLEESLAIRREQGHRQGIARLLGNLGMVAHSLGDHPAARALYEESLAIYRELGDRRGIATSLSNQGDAALKQGDNPAARTLLEESLAIRRELGDRRGVAELLEELAAVAAALVDPPRRPSSGERRNGCERRSARQ